MQPGCIYFYTMKLAVHEQTNMVNRVVMELPVCRHNANLAYFQDQYGIPIHKDGLCMECNCPLIR